jgi:hypothetical protein
LSRCETSEFITLHCTPVQCYIKSSGWFNAAAESEFEAGEHPRSRQSPLGSFRVSGLVGRP